MSDWRDRDDFPRPEDGDFNDYLKDKAKVHRARNRSAKERIEDFFGKVGALLSLAIRSILSLIIIIGLLICLTLIVSKCIEDYALFAGLLVSIHFVAILAYMSLALIAFLWSD